MTLSAIARPASLVEDVCQRLATEIRAERNGGDGWLPPERQLAEQLGVSRTVIREATKRLELQGLIEVQHGIGIKVVDKLHKPLNGSLALLIPDTADRLRQLVEVRLLVEPEVARLAAERVKPVALRALKQVQARLAAAANMEEAIELDLEFHRQLARASGNEVLVLLLESLGELGRKSRSVTVSTTGIARAHEQHEAVLAAVAAGDADRAHTAMQFHIREAAADLARQFKQSAKATR